MLAKVSNNSENSPAPHTVIWTASGAEQWNTKDIGLLNWKSHSSYQRQAFIKELFINVSLKSRHTQAVFRRPQVIVGCVDYYSRLFTHLSQDYNGQRWTWRQRDVSERNSTHWQYRSSASAVYGGGRPLLLQSIASLHESQSAATSSM